MSILNFIFTLESHLISPFIVGHVLCLLKFSPRVIQFSPVFLISLFTYIWLFNELLFNPDFFKFIFTLLSLKPTVLIPQHRVDYDYSTSPRTYFSLIFFCSQVVTILKPTRLNLITLPELPFAVIWCSKHIVKDLWEFQSEGLFTEAGL